MIIYNDYYQDWSFYWCAWILQVKTEGLLEFNTYVLSHYAVGNVFSGLYDYTLPTITSGGEVLQSFDNISSGTSG